MWRLYIIYALKLNIEWVQDFNESILICYVQTVQTTFPLMKSPHFRVVLTMDETPYLNVYSTMFENKHSQIVVDDNMQTCTQENIAYDDKKTQRTITSKNYSKQ